MKTPQRDKNEAALVKELRALGYLVQPLHQGDGVPDLIVASPHPFTERGEKWGRRELLLVEVKDPAAKERRKLTPAQVKWHAQWASTPLVVAETVDEVVRAFAGDVVEKGGG